MKVARFNRVRPALTVSDILSGSAGPDGQVVTSIGSNTVSWGSNVAIITSNGSNTLVGPYVNFISGSGIAFAAASNSLTISSTGSGGGGGGGGGGLTFISETVLGSPAAEINVTGIPNTPYRDLVLVARFRSATVSTKAIRMLLGDSSAIDTGTNYSFRRDYSGTLATGGGDGAGVGYIEVGALPGSGSTAGFFGAGRWEILDYASTSRSRIVIGNTYDDANDGTFKNDIGGMWRNVTAAVARVRLVVSDTSNFDTGSSLAVYGRG